jgi:hypothetical protein
MSAIIYGALAYWGACVVFSFVAMLYSCPDESLKRKEQLIFDAPSPRREVAIALSAVVVALIAPVLAPNCLIQGYLEYRRETAFQKWLIRTYRENVYVAIHPENLPKAARGYFDQKAAAFISAGFREIGRYLLKPEPAPSYGYCFQSSDGRTLGVIGHMLDATYFSFTTLFANGLVFETASVEETPRLARVNQSDRYRVVFSPGTSVAENFVRHENQIARWETSFGTRALAYEPAQFRDVLTYEGRVFSLWRYDRGELDAPPPPAILPHPV